MIKFKNVRKSYKDNVILENFDLDIEDGKIVVLIGASGSGKTTLLKMINRLIPMSGGEIAIEDKNINDMNPIELRRGIGYVIQQTGLFPHMTVRENIEIIPKLLGKNEVELELKCKELLEMVGLEYEKYIDRYPTELSGGQQQRVGVARAFATDPEIILMDEPFSALDPITRAELQEQLFEIQKEYKKTIVFVTHDMDEALKIGDMICILQNGKILQYDTPENILKNPAGEYVEEFIGKNKIWSMPELIKAKDVMIVNPIKVSKKRNVLQATEIMKEKKVDSLLVVDKSNELLGYVTLEQVRRIDDKQVILEDIMHTNFESVNEDENLIALLEKFNSVKRGYLPVCSEGKELKGLVTRSSLISVMSSQYIEIGGDN